MKHRVALVGSHVIQYQAPFFRLLAADPDIDLTVLYCSRAGSEVYRDEEMQTELRWDVPLLGGYRARFPRNFGRGSSYGRLANPGIVPAILFGPFDAVILFLGWGTITSLLAVAACRARGLPFFLYGDSSFPPEERNARDHLRAGFLRAVFRLATGFLVSGKLNADYYAHYGADRSRFFLVPWAVDNERFESGSRLHPDDRRALRRTTGADDDDVLFVFSAKLLPRKDPMTLLRAAARMRHRARAVLLFLGHGELLDQLDAFAREHALRTHFAGFVNQAELPRWYGAADVFVLPSTYEPRGAVVNEAMASGLPVVVTDRCGSIGDLVLDQENALVYRAGDADALATAMDALVEDPAGRAAMASRSREIVAAWDFRRGVEGVRAALEATVRRDPR